MPPLLPANDGQPDGYRPPSLFSYQGCLLPGAGQPDAGVGQPGQRAAGAELCLGGIELGALQTVRQFADFGLRSGPVPGQKVIRGQAEQFCNTADVRGT